MVREKEVSVVEIWPGNCQRRLAQPCWVCTDLEGRPGQWKPTKQRYPGPNGAGKTVSARS